MDLQPERCLAKSTTITVYHDEITPSAGFSTSTTSPAMEELAPGWALDDVYPPLAELRRALLTDEEWAAMSSWEKDVWELFYRPDWERLACIEQILEGTPAAQRDQKHEEIREALRKLEASASQPASVATATSYIDARHAIPIDAASSSNVEKALEVILPESTSILTTAPATCSTDFLPELQMASLVRVVFWLPTPIECGLDNTSMPVAVVPPATSGVFPAVFAHSTQFQQPYNGSELSRPNSSQRITSMVPVHRPMPWRCFMGIHADGDEARPRPWPSFRGIIGCDCSGDTISKPAHSSSKKGMDDIVIVAPSESIFMKPFAATLVQSMEKSLKVTSPLAYSKLLRSEFYGNLFTCTGCECKSGELRCWNEVVLFLEYWWSTSDCVQPVHECNSPFATSGCIIVYYLCNCGEWRRLKEVLLFLENWGYASAYVQSIQTLYTTLVWTSCPILGLPLLVIVRSLELKLLSHGSTAITLLTVVGSISCAPLSCEYLGVDIVDCVDSWLFPCWSVAACQESSTHASSGYFIARETTSGVLSSLDWRLLDFPCNSAAIVCLSYPQGLDHYFCSSHRKKSPTLNSSRRSDISYDQFACAIWDASYWIWVHCLWGAYASYYRWWHDDTCMFSEWAE